MTLMTQTTNIARPITRRVSLGHAFAVLRQRRDLARLDDQALADIGLTRQQALAEARRGFWDID